MTCATHTPITANTSDCPVIALPTTTSREAALAAIYKANLLGNVLHDDLYSICARPNSTPGFGTVMGLLAVATQIQRHVDACILALVEFQAEAYLDQGKP